MNTANKHTPGPYRYDDTWGIVYGDDDKEMAACHSNKADAAFIVRACNAHDDLLAALEALRKQLHDHVKLDVKKHYSLMLADVAAEALLVKVSGHA